MQNLQMSQAGLALLCQFEGLSLKAYRDSVGVITIGYGSTNSILPPGVAPITMSTVWTLQQAQAALNYAINTEIVPRINSLLVRAITQEQFDALCDFTYNEGITNLAGSTLLKFLNDGDNTDAQLQFGKWDLAGGKYNRGLARRRLAEALMFGPITDANVLISQSFGGVDPRIATS